MSVTAAFAVLLPLTGGCAGLVFGRGRAAVTVGTTAVTLAIVLCVVAGVWQEGAARVAIGGWAAPLGIELVLDGLSAGMMAATALTIVLVLAYAWSDSGRAPAPVLATAAGSFQPLTLFLWAGLNAVFLSGDLFNLYVALELTTLTAVAMVVLEDETAAVVAGTRYLLAAFGGSLAYLAGVALLYAATGTLDTDLIGPRMPVDALGGTATALIVAGLALKSALFPLHFWLPRAHASAAAPVSALLSGLVVTAAFYVFLRLWFGPVYVVVTAAAAQLVGILGAAAIVWGSLQALRQQRLKLMVAYSTVAQVGYLFLVFPLVAGLPNVPEAGAWAENAWAGGVYHAIAHGIAKAAMFTAAGAMARALGDDRIVGVRGLANHLPVATAAFGLGGMTLIGVPPSGGFIAKWLLLDAAIRGGQWWWAVVILVGGILTTGYVFQVLTQEFSHSEGDAQPRLEPVPRVMEYASLALALIAVALGVRATEPLALIRIGGPFSGE